MLFRMREIASLHLMPASSLQVNDVEGLLAAAEKLVEALQGDKDWLLSMVSRLELEKHRLETGRPAGSTGGTPAPATPGSAESSSRSAHRVHRPVAK
jgi:hypothetical protein